DVGLDGVQAAFLLLQHSDDAQLMRNLQPRLEHLVAVNQFSRADYALFLDRLLLAEGKPQIYGTQLITRDGRAELAQPVDEGNIEKRRASMGLIPLSEYLSLQ